MKLPVPPPLSFATLSLCLCFTGATRADLSPRSQLADLARDLLGGMTSTEYQHRTEIDEAEGSLRCDCSGLVGYLLRKNFAWAYLALHGDEASWRTRPLSVTYHETFVRAPQEANSPWIRIPRILDARPGDVLAWRKDEVVRGSSTGHTLMIAGLPVKEADGRVRVRVIDSTRRIHAEDTRPKGKTGVGEGTMWFVPDDAGEPVGFYVDDSNRRGSSTQIAIGRLNPEFDPSQRLQPEKAQLDGDGEFLGLPAANAGALAEKRGLEWRVVTEEHQTSPVSLSKRNTRVNFAVHEGVVTRVERG